MCLYMSQVLLYRVFKSMSKTKGFRAYLNAVLQVLASDKAAYIIFSKKNSKTKKSPIHLLVVMQYTV